MPSKAELWCRGREGKEHQAVITLANRTLGELGRCGFHGTKTYHCVHTIQCQVCKRVLRTEWEMTAEECPSARSLSMVG